MTDEISHQPTIPDLELPSYHGRKPVGMRTSISGVGNRITREHGIGDRTVAVVEIRCSSAGHKEIDDALHYVETFKVLDLYELDRDAGARLLSTVRSAYRTADDQVKGREPLPGAGHVGYADASGVVLTEVEVAALRGDPVRVLLTEQLTPAVIVYDDGTRDLWPDEYAKDAPRPIVGETRTVNGETSEVVELLHHETGERLELHPLSNGDDTDEALAYFGAPELAADGLPADPEFDVDPPSGDPVPESPPIDTSAGAIATNTGDAFYGDDDPDPADLDGVGPFDQDASLDDGTSLDDDAPADDWEPPTPPRPLLPGEAEAIDVVEILKGNAKSINAKLPEISDLFTLRRLRQAEMDGRARKIVLSDLADRIEAVGNEAAS